MNTFKGQAGLRLAVVNPNHKGTYVFLQGTARAAKKLEKQIEEAKSREYAEVLNEIKQKMADYGISLSELGGGRAPRVQKAARPRAGVAPKYRDPESGSTWSGSRQTAALDCGHGSRQVSHSEVIRRQAY